MNKIEKIRAGVEKAGFQVSDNEIKECLNIPIDKMTDSELTKSFRIRRSHGERPVAHR